MFATKRLPANNGCIRLETIHPKAAWKSPMQKPPLTSRNSSRARLRSGHPQPKPLTTNTLAATPLVDRRPAKKARKSSGVGALARQRLQPKSQRRMWREARELRTESSLFLLLLRLFPLRCLDTLLNFAWLVELLDSIVSASWCGEGTLAESGSVIEWHELSDRRSAFEINPPRASPSLYHHSTYTRLAFRHNYSLESSHKTLLSYHRRAFQC
jgi:hypothetical protein